MYKHFMKVVYNFHESYKHFIHMAESFSKILLKFKNDYRLTQRAIADILGISERMYIMYEKGDYDGSQKRIEKYQKKINDFIEKPNKVKYNSPVRATLTTETAIFYSGFGFLKRFIAVFIAVGK